MAIRWKGIQCTANGGILPSPYHDLVSFLWADDSRILFTDSTSEVSI